MVSNLVASGRRGKEHCTLVTTLSHLQENGLPLSLFISRNRRIETPSVMIWIPDKLVIIVC